jgi:hypothetical protein
MRLRVLAAAAAAAAAGCALLARLPHPFKVPPAPPTFSQYHLEGWNWEEVGRVVVLPFLNESPYTRAGDEVWAAFSSELQKLGRFEVVAAPPDDRAVLAALVHRGGRFDEAEMLHLARVTRADVIVHGIITHYSPYPRPRLGLIVQAVGPLEAKVVASVDGLWDTTDVAVAERLRAYYRQRPCPRPAFIRNHVIVSDDAFAGELALDSPALFQRWVCHEAVLTLLGLPVPGILGGVGVFVGGPVPVVGTVACPAPAAPPGPPAPIPGGK